MNKEFIPYEEALALKELGFDEPFEPFNAFYYRNKRLCEANKGSLPYFEYCKDEVILAPLYQQAFRWFREKYNLYANIYPIASWEKKICWTIQLLNKETKIHVDYGEPKGFSISAEDSWEEAELACLRKLIEIVKEKK